MRRSQVPPNHRLGITLLELAIILAILGVLIFIALPTMTPTTEEANIDFAKDELQYLHDMEQQYFTAHGKYAPISTLAKDPELGKKFDKRFAKEDPLVNGIQFYGPKQEGPTYEITAVLPKEAGRYKVDQSGNVAALP